MDRKEPNSFFLFSFSLSIDPFLFCLLILTKEKPKMGRKLDSLLHVWLYSYWTQRQIYW
uniref:Uncharacterized protein n=1 Tax=Rhizophora mucronata TaxID=61149 RepID=A0A2P2PPK3_RHIMU